MFRLRNYLPTKTVRTAADILKDYKGMVADIACGKGVLLKEIDQHNDKKIVGIDRAWDQITDARKAGMSVVKGNIFSMPFNDNMFDLAVCLNTIYNFSSLSDLEPVFKEMVRIVEKKGRIVIDTRNRSNPVIRIKYWLHNRKNRFLTVPHNPADIENKMDASGCRLIKRCSVGINNQYLAWGYIMVFEKKENIK